MLDFVDKKYGRFLILEPIDISTSYLFTKFDGISAYIDVNFDKLNNINIAAFRNIITREVKIFKNRFGSIEDYEIEQFVLNYEEEKIEPILTRWEILDIR